MIWENLLGIRMMLFIVFSSSRRHFLAADLVHLCAVAHVKFVFLHYHEVAVRYLIHHLIVRQMQRFNERCYLAQETGVAYGLGLAVRLDTFLVKTDSLEKFSTEINE